MDEVLLSITSLGFILVGILTGAFFCYRILQAGRSKQWPWVLGELESADLRQVIYNGREIDGSADQASAMVVNFSYQYRVSNHDYRGRRVTFSDSVNKTMGALKKLQDRYQGKSQIKVYYNPHRPEQSVLIPGLNLFNFTPLITSALFLLAGIFVGVYDFS